MEYASGNIYIRPNTLENVGDKVDGHAHHFDHTTIFFKGAFRVTRTLPDGRTEAREFSAPAHCLILAEAVHEIVALEPDSQFWCVYAHRTPQGDIVQSFTGWEPAYV